MLVPVQAMLKKIPLSAQLIVIMTVVSTFIGIVGAVIYIDRKTTSLEEKIALEIVEAGRRFQKDLTALTAVTPPIVRKKLTFLAVFPYVKCAELVEDKKAKGAWPIPVCKPILKKFETRPVSFVINETQQLIFHIDETYIANAVKTERDTFISIIIFMLVVLSVIIIGFIIMAVTTPFHIISRNLAVDDDGIVRPVPVIGGVEFRSFINAYNGLVDDVIAKTKEVTAWRSRIKNELEQADAVQALLVPPQLSQPGIDARAVSLRELSGDFHEIFTHEDGRRTMILGDVAGKGIYAAMMLAQTLTAFRASVHHDRLTDVLVELNTLIEDRFPDGLFVALTLVRTTPDGKTAEVLVTGNPDAVWISHNGDMQTHASVGPAIGVLPPMIYAMHEAVTVNLEEGSLFIFSDGISDLIIGEDGQGFADDAEMLSYLKALEADHGDNALDQLMAVVETYEQIDDVTITRISYQPSA